MMHRDPTAETVLDQMHNAILRADFAQLGGLAGLLETALNDLQGLPDAPRLQRLRAQAERNQACLLAAGRGVRAAGRRFKELRDAASGLITYDDKGKRADLGQNSRLTRRY
jgi:hypothetical protein